MDSQLTLVDYNPPLPNREARTVLSFSRDSLLDTVLCIRGTSSPVYIVQTNQNTTRTTINRIIPASQQGSVKVVRIDRNELSPDKITFEGFPPLKIKDWLAKQTFTDPALLNDVPSVRYVWKPTSIRELALYNESFPFRPIAWFCASIPGVESASLSFQSEAELRQDAVLASLIIVEQKYRVRGKRMGLSVNKIVYMPGIN